MSFVSARPGHCEASGSLVEHVAFRSDFHIVGAIFDRVYPDGNPDNVLEGVQTYTVPAGGGAVFETVFESGASGEGLYPFVTHAFANAGKGAVGLVQVSRPATAVTTAILGG